KRIGSVSDRMQLQVAEMAAGLRGAGAVISPVRHVAERLHGVDDFSLGAKFRRRPLSVNPDVLRGNLGQLKNLLRFGMGEDSRTFLNAECRMQNEELRKADGILHSAFCIHALGRNYELLPRAADDYFVFPQRLG